MLSVQYSLTVEDDADDDDDDDEVSSNDASDEIDAKRRDASKTSISLKTFSSA